jgi:transposase
MSEENKPNVPESARKKMVELKGMGYGTRKIAPRVGYSRKVVSKILREEGLLPPSNQQPKSKLDPFRQTIEDKVKQGLTTSRILREIKELGYQGQRTILAEFASTVRARHAPQSTRIVKRRFETKPGEEMQIDWSPYKLHIAGAQVIVHAFACLLCFCRKLFVYFFKDERQSTLLQGMSMSFEYFDGCAQRVVLDNMSTAVLGRYAVNGKPIWHERFLDFARHYGFQPFACAVRDPDRKGKKEKSFRLLWDDFLKASEFESFDDLNRRARIWLDHTPHTGNQRVHGTTRRVPNDAWLSERDLLIQLPEKRFPFYRQETRSVDQDSTISVRGTTYTVPSALANRTVTVNLYAEHFEVLDRHKRVTFSRRYVPDAQKGTLVIDETHHATRRRRPPVSSGRLDQEFIKRYPTLAPLVSGLQLKMKSLASVHLRALLRLADRYGQEAFLAAATRAQTYRRFDANAVQRILEQEQGEGELPITTPLAGSGPALLGEVEPGSLDTFGYLDTQTTNGHKNNNNEEEE